MQLSSSYDIDSSPIPGTRRVFAAMRRSDSARVLVKRPRSEFPIREEVAVLRHERAVLALLRGEPVTEVLDFIHDAGNLGLVLAPAAGQSLDSIIAEGVPAVSRGVALALSASKALAAVHARRLVHRDIKPEHFFVDERTGEARLIDFGLSTQLSRERQVPVQLDELYGTLAYSSPEQTGRTNHSVDRRSDLYSLGVTLYELFTGERPFVAEDPLELMHAHIARAPTPLRGLRPELPEVLETIVLRLLAKSSEARYQTAAGLIADLQKVQQELAQGGAVAPFELGKDDHDGELRIPEKLYGRDVDRAALLEMVRRVKRGGRELLLIAGPPGGGKSALVHELHPELVRRGHFVSGKFDQYNRGIPYSALATACGELVRVYLASGVKELESWRNRLSAALGDNVRVVVDVVPELKLALGELPEVTPLPPGETQLRFERSFRRFMEVSACEDAPLVMFLDDLQWADSASLAVLELVLSSRSQGHLLVIGSYRDTEVDATHPLSSMLQRLQGQVRVERLELDALSRANVRELVRDTFPLTMATPAALADLIFDKTSGNPFFVRQFLERLSSDGLITFDASSGYGWDLGAIAALPATDNVVDLVVQRLAGLTPETQSVLRLAACIGHTFALHTLALIAELEPADVVRAMAPAVAGGYVVPLDRNHRLLEDLLREGADAVSASYRFAHDRVQQAALATLDETQRSLTHLRVGRLLLAAAGQTGPTEERLFEVVSQLNLGCDQIQDAAERQQLARLNLRAARRAKSAAAHASVLELTDNCLGLLGPKALVENYETATAAHLLAAEAQYLSHADDRALEHIETIERNARDVLDRVLARNLKTTIVTRQGKPVEATYVSIETLALLGLNVPDVHNPESLGPAIGEAFGAYQAELGARDVQSLRELPAMTDPQKLALLATIAGVIPSAFQWNPNLVVLLVLKAVRLPLEYGTAPVSPFFYAQYGIVHRVVTEDSVRAHEFGLLALELSGRPEFAAARGGVEFIYATFLAPWVRPRTESSQHFQQGIVSGLDAGDQVHAGYCMAVGAAEAFYSGYALALLDEEIPGYLQALTEHGDVLNHTLLRMLGRAVACLRGATTAPASMDGDGFSEERFVAEAPPPNKAHYGAVRTILRFFAGDFEAAREMSEAVMPPPGVVFKVECVFYHAMACARLAPSASAERREQLLREAEADLQAFEPWVTTCPHNFLELAELLRGELNAVRGEATAALAAYDKALAAASRSRAVHHLALIQECAGRFHLAQGRKQLARIHLRESLRHYENWGAASVTRRLRDEFPEMMLFDGPDVPDGTSQTRAKNPSGSASAGSLDLTSAIRAVKAITSEIRLEPLQSRLMQILVENAGATRGALLLSEHGDLVLRAALHAEPAEAAVTLNEPVEHSQLVPASLVRYCARTLESVVLDDATRDNRFAQDPFVLERRTRSAICLPLMHQSQLVGVLYLENDAVVGAFHAARIERLEFLAGHAAVALQNARLYEQLEAANESLEQRVRTRTAELSERNRDMRRVLDNVTQGLLTVDLDGRLASERSRAVGEWFGDFAAQTPFADYVGRISPAFADGFLFAWEQLRAGLLPEAVALDQLPRALSHDEKHFEISYEPIHVENNLSGLLIVIDDVTDARRRARDEAEQHEVVALCRSLSNDRSGLLGFFAEGHTLVERLARAASAGDETFVRDLHTLKGTAALFGFKVLGDLCHGAEQAVAEGRVEHDVLEAPLHRFRSLHATLLSIAGATAEEKIELSRSALRDLSRRLELGMAPRDAAQAVERLLLEPLGTLLSRLGDYAQTLSERLGRGELNVESDDAGLLMDRERSAPFFGALVHLVRNAIDHGLESPQERQAAGKGHPLLSLSASLVDDELVIAVEDDGRGIDWKRIKELAQERGLATDTERALLAALFAPNLSTSEMATSVSGRGVGLAAVQAEVNRLQGRIEVSSSEGTGTRFTVHVLAAALGVQSGAPASRGARGRESSAPMG